MKRIGILALQGAFVEHLAVLNKLGVEAVLIRLPREVKGLDGLIIPGGESTTIGKLMAGDSLDKVIRKLALDGLPILGTCAGMVLLSRVILNSSQQPIGAIDIEVRRNAFGRQVDSFEIGLPMPALGDKPFPGVFIRAPLIEKAGPEVEILARLPAGAYVAARQRNVVVSAFHPELTDDLRFHSYFLGMVEGTS